MDKEPVKQVTDAVDLIKMLEHLTEGYVRGGNREEIPWAGIRLTLAQSREILIGAREKLSRGGSSYDTSTGGRFEQAPASGPAIVDRVQQTQPGGGRMRELLNNVGNVSQPGGRTTAGKVGTESVDKVRDQF